MEIGISGFSEFALSESGRCRDKIVLDPDLPSVTQQRINEILDDECSGCLTYFVKALPYDTTAEFKISYDYGDIGMGGISSTSDCLCSVGRVVEFKNASSPLMFDQFIKGDMQTSYSITTKAFNGDEPNGTGSTSAGILKLSNLCGEYDDLSCYTWGGRDISICLGRKCYQQDEYVEIFKGKFQGIQFNDNEITFNLRDNSEKFNNLNVQENKYDGSGDLNGNIDVENKPRPLCYGLCYNVSPVLIDASRQIYQVHDGEIDSVLEVRDKGIPLTFSSNVTNILTATPSLGGYAVDLQNGYIRLGGQPAGQITMDVQGHVGSSGWINNTVDIITDLVSTRLGQCNLTYPDDFDTATFARVLAQHAYTIGIYIDSDRTIASILSEIMSSANGYWGFNRQGQLEIGLIRPVDIDDTDFCLNECDIVNKSFGRLSSPSASWRRNVNYARNWTPQNENDLAFGISDQNREFALNQYRTVFSENVNLQSIYLNSKEITRDSLLAYQSDAETFADELLDLYSNGIERFKIKVSCGLLKYWRGDRVKLSYPRYKLDDGRAFQILEIQENDNSENVTMTLIG